MGNPTKKGNIIYINNVKDETEGYVPIYGMTIYGGYIISNSFGEDAVYEEVSNWIIKIPAMLSRLEIAVRVCVMTCLYMF